jgi:hypothetical protein
MNIVFMILGVDAMREMNEMQEPLFMTVKRGLLSRGHFSVYSSLIQAWASHNSFRAKDGTDDGPPASGGRNADTDWKGKRRGNDTHESSTDRTRRPSLISPAISISGNTPSPRNHHFFPECGIVRSDFHIEVNRNLLIVSSQTQRRHRHRG